MLDELRASFRSRKFRVGLHAHLRHLERGIDVSRLVEAIGFDAPTIIENYPDDPRGPSCLILGVVDGSALHVVVTVEVEPLVITAYWPDADRWTADFRQRREP